MNADKHHPSCKPSDRDLIWFCNQCGAREPAGDVMEVISIPNCRDMLLVYKGSGIWREVPCEMGPAEKPIRFREVIETNAPKFPTPERKETTINQRKKNNT